MQHRVEDLLIFETGLENGYVVSWALRELLRDSSFCYRAEDGELCGRN